MPGYDGLRVPARFAMLAVFCLSVSAGLAAARLLSLAGRAGPAILVAALAGLAADGAMRGMPLAPPPPRTLLPNAAGAVLELPADDARVNVAAMYRAIEHRRPIVNGYSGYTPPHFVILGLALRRGDASPLTYLAAGRTLAIVVNDRYDDGGDFKRLVDSVPGMKALGVAGAGTVFQLDAQPRFAAAPAGRALAFTRRDAGGQRLVLDLATPQIVRALTFNLRWHYPELGERLRVEQSADGEVWTSAWLGLDRGPRRPRRDRGSAASSPSGFRCRTSAPVTCACTRRPTGWPGRFPSAGRRKATATGSGYRQIGSRLRACGWPSPPSNSVRGPSQRVQPP